MVQQRVLLGGTKREGTLRAPTMSSSQQQEEITESLETNTGASASAVAVAGAGAGAGAGAVAGGDGQNQREPLGRDGDHTHTKDSGGGGVGDGGVSSTSGGPREENEVFELKTIPFLGRDVSVILQNANGPCPLLAIANVLLLRNTIRLPATCVEVTRTIHVQQILSIVAEHMLDANKETKQPRDLLDKDQEMRIETIRRNISDAISILPKLLTGVDVNPRFATCRAFEFTDEVAIFDLLDISLFHGWIYDSRSEEAKCIGNMSYNQLVERIINWDVRGEQQKQQDQNQEGQDGRDIVIIRDFLEESSSQLTTEGLFALQEEMKESELAVFFRNNHFSTIFKYQNQLHLLMTDSGYKEMVECWETLTDVSGNNQFSTIFERHDAGNNNNKQLADLPMTSGLTQSAYKDMNRADVDTADFALALQLQEEEVIYGEQEAMKEQQRRREREIQLQRQREREIQLQRQREQQQKQKSKCTIS